MGKDHDEIPHHLRGPKTVSLGNATTEDLVWIGPSGEIDPEIILKQHGHDSNDPFASILSAIIKGNPVKGKDDTERLEIALEALIGTPRKRGMDELDDDYELLLEVARRFFMSFHRDGHVEPDLAGIIRNVVALIPEGDKRRLATADSVIRRLRKKLNKNKDVLLVRVTSEENWDRMDVARSVDAILQQIKALGVSIRKT